MQKYLLLTLALIPPILPAEAQVYSLMCFDSNANKLLEEPTPLQSPNNDALREFAEKKCRPLPQCVDPSSDCRACHWLGYSGQSCLNLINGVWSRRVH